MRHRLHREASAGITGLAAVVLTFMACTPPRPSAQPEPMAPDTTVMEVRPSAVGPWSFALRDGVHRYELRSRAIVEALDSTVVDTVELVAVLSYVVGRVTDSSLVHGTIDSFSVSSRSAPPAHSAVLPVPFQMTIDSAGRVAAFSSPDTSTCGSPTGTLLAIARDLFIPIPPVVHLGQEWADTISATSCRGDIPVTIVSSRVNRVAGTSTDTTSGNVLVHVHQQSTIEVSGTGTRRIQSTTITGAGQGWTERLLDPATGVLLGGQGESTLELTFDAASRHVRFRQHVNQTIRRL